MCTKILMEGIIATTDSVVNIVITSLQQLIRWSIWSLHRCNKRFGGQYGHYIIAANDSVVNMAHYIIAANDSVVNMAITSLQQLIRWSIWPLHRCNS